MTTLTEGEKKRKLVYKFFYRIWILYSYEVATQKLYHPIYVPETLNLKRKKKSIDNLFLEEIRKQNKIPENLIV